MEKKTIKRIILLFSVQVQNFCIIMWYKILELH